MAKKKGKSVSFDAMVKFFMHAYHIPTKRDIDRIMAALERIERSIVSAGLSRTRRDKGIKAASTPNAATAADVVLQVIRSAPEGAALSTIQTQTGFGEKKLRNVIFRLHKLGKIKRKSRGIYIQVTPQP